MKASEVKLPEIDFAVKLNIKELFLSKRMVIKN
jgi:hypothetical protein